MGHTGLDRGITRHDTKWTKEQWLKKYREQYLDTNSNVSVSVVSVHVRACAACV